MSATLNPSLTRRARAYLPLCKEREDALLDAYQAGDMSARDALIEAHLTLVTSMAMRFRRSSLELDELVAEGNLALLRALGSFDRSHGVRFRTHAAYWVRAALLEHLVRGSRTFGGGTGPFRTKTYFRLRRERSRLEAAGVSSTEIPAALATRLGVPVERVHAWLEQLDARVVSASLPSRDDESPLEGRLPDHAPDAETQLHTRRERAAQAEQLARALATLDERERFLVQHTFADDDEARTVADLARELGISRERARQLHQRALGKLRRAFGVAEEPARLPVPATRNAELADAVEAAMAA